MRLTKLVKLGETRNLLGFGHKLFLTYCVPFLSREWLTAKTVLLLDNAPDHIANIAEVRTPLDINCFYFIKFYFVASHCIFVYHKQTKRGGNSNFKAYYLLLNFIEMVRVSDRWLKPIKYYWFSSNILKGAYNINIAWEEVSVKCLKGVWGKLLWTQKYKYMLQLYIYIYI